jgi:hypothetical protein
VNLGHRQQPSAPKRETLRLLSRFPQGLSSELRGRLLASLGQDAVDEVQP